jgi:hypothetical protein
MAANASDRAVTSADDNQDGSTDTTTLSPRQWAYAVGAGKTHPQQIGPQCLLTRNSTTEFSKTTPTFRPRRRLTTTTVITGP